MEILYGLWVIPSSVVCVMACFDGKVAVTFGDKRQAVFCYATWDDAYSAAQLAASILNGDGSTPDPPHEKPVEADKIVTFARAAA